MKEKLIYGMDGSRMFGNPISVVFPKNLDEVKNAIISSENVVPRGMASNIVGACIPNNSVVIDMKKMDKVIFDFKSKLAIVEPGVTVRELNEKLKPIGYEFPILEEGTIGGLIAMNSSGIMGKYGYIKDWIREIEFVNGKGEIVKIGKADLGDVIGMEGTTGIITKVKLELISLIERSISIFQSEDIEEIFNIAKRLKSEKDIVMLRLYSPYISQLLSFPEKYHIIIGFNSDRGKIKGEEYKQLFNKIRKDKYYMSYNGYYNSEDPQFFFDKLKDFVSSLNQLKVPYFGDLNLGIIQVFFRDEIRREEVVKIIKRMNGKPGKYGFGLKRKNLLDSLQRKIILRIKSRHDPLNKLNRGKVIDLDKEILLNRETEVKYEEKESVNEINRVKEVYKEIKEVDVKGSNIEKVEEDLERGRVSIGDNLNRVVKRKVSSEDMDLINKIMLNKFKKEENKEKK